MSMWTNTYLVLCQSCNARHDTKYVKFLNIEEDIDRRDIVTFTCPDTGEIVKSWVFRGGIGEITF